ncbi:hypothetical protein LWI28_022418 [Acer negundo]|uniref:Uncharacterized protein n=1 Tax=Acer negundo TaxID=4023 RepID=A0AAD5NXI1_ACENE|nr:hypothetical protein LWI28_022418 [Acer negundo]
MSSLKFSVFFVFLLSLSGSLLAFTSASDPSYLYHICLDKNFTINSTYQSNLNRLLFSLSSYTDRSKIFYRTTEGDDPNKAYGLFQCRGDVTTSTCQDCVAFASTDAVQRCPAQKEATIWYDECYLRFSDSNIFYDADLKRTYILQILMWNTNNVTIEPSRFHELLLKMMNKAADQAAEVPERFATIKGNSTTSQTMYGLLQCTQDLYITDCRECLSNAIANMPTGSVGGRVLLASCTCRYELYPFYNESLTALSPATPTLSPPATPTLSPPTPLSKPKEKTQISSSTIIAIVAPLTVAAVLFVAVYCILTRRARKKNITTEDEIDGKDILTAETLQFDLGTIQAATNRFSTDNKLGAGGFGVVYKGVLPNGKDIAVKRLSKRSGQDFGMARIVGVDQTQGNTSKIVGTYGYMAPEYAMQGQFSVKSDVYSFGVLVLEIITGKKNSSFYQTNSVGNLLSYAWELWRDETPMQLKTELNMHISNKSTKSKPLSVDAASITELCPR